MCADGVILYFAIHEQGVRQEDDFFGGSAHADLGACASVQCSAVRTAEVCAGTYMRMPMRTKDGCGACAGMHVCACGQAVPAGAWMCSYTHMDGREAPMCICVCLQAGELHLQSLGRMAEAADDELLMEQEQRRLLQQQPELLASISGAQVGGAKTAAAATAAAAAAAAAGVWLSVYRPCRLPFRRAPSPPCCSSTRTHTHTHTHTQRPGSCTRTRRSTVAFSSCNSHVPYTHAHAVHPHMHTQYTKHMRAHLRIAPQVPRGGSGQASTSAPGAGTKSGGGGGSSMFASMSFGMGGATRVLMGALTRAAGRAPARRPHVLRPSHARAAAAASGAAVAKGSKRGGERRAWASLNGLGGVAGWGGLGSGAWQQQQRQHQQ